MPPRPFDALQRVKPPIGVFIKSLARQRETYSSLPCRQCAILGISRLKQADFPCLRPNKAASAGTSQGLLTKKRSMKLNDIAHYPAAHGLRHRACTGHKFYSSMSLPGGHFARG
jgi:hypothetical protein